MPDHSAPRTQHPALVVVGSLMMDLVIRVPRRPGPGETVFGTGFGMFLGGKGFNQALSARRLGAHVALVGRVGDDDFGRALREALIREGVDAVGLVVDPETGTGVAAPVIEESGENSIISVPRANMCLTPADVERQGEAIAAADALLLQLEVPVEASLAAARRARAAGTTVLLNTAPAGQIADELLAAANLIVANEVEAAMLTGMGVESVAEAYAAAERLRRPGQIAIVTLGAQGAVAVSDRGRIHAPAHTVTVQDTTGAGDAFCGALAVRLAETGDLAEALRWANAAGGCAVTTLGAEPSLPRRQAVTALLEEKNRPLGG